MSNTPGGLLWKRRQNDIMADISSADRYHEESRVSSQMTASAPDVENEMDSHEHPDDSLVFTSSNGSVSEDLSITSAYHSRKPHFPSDNIKFNQGRSASHEALNSRSQDSGSIEGPERQASTSVTSRWTRPTSGGNKRLSREDIQAAIERADSYLQSTGSGSSLDEEKPPASGVNVTDMTRSDISHNHSQSADHHHTAEPRMSQSDSTVHSGNTDGELKSWALYRKQRYSQPQLDDKVGDVSKLGSISDTSVRGFRKASFENLSKSPTDKSPESKPEAKPAADLFAGISQSSVLNRRNLRSQQPPAQSTPPASATPASATAAALGPASVNGASIDSSDSKPIDRISVTDSVKDTVKPVSTVSSVTDSGVSATNTSRMDRLTDSKDIDSDVHSTVAEQIIEPVSLSARPLPMPRRSAGQTPPADTSPIPPSLQQVPPPRGTQQDVRQESLDHEIEPVTVRGKDLASIPPVPIVDPGQDSGHEVREDITPSTHSVQEARVPSRADPSVPYRHHHHHREPDIPVRASSRRDKGSDVVLGSGTGVTQEGSRSQEVTQEVRGSGVFQEVEMRDKARVLDLEEPEETSDSEPVIQNTTHG